MPPRKKTTEKAADWFLLPSLGVRMDERAKRSIIFDTETIGLLVPGEPDLAKQPKIIEFGAIEFDEAYNVLGRHNWLINPGEALPAVITKITGIKDADLRDAPFFSDVLPQIRELFIGAERVLCHNAPFDQGMLVNELTRLGLQFDFPYPRWECTVQLARETIDDRYMKMTELYELVTGKPLAQTHRAIEDCEALFEIVKTQRW